MALPSAPNRNTPGQAPVNAPEIQRECRTRYLKQLGQLLQEAEPLPSRAVDAFLKAVGGYFDEMASTQRRSGFEEAHGLTASRISLVGDNDLELEIRLGEFSARLLETTGGDLWRVYLRFVTLLGRPDLSTADNPVGPKGIALGLTELCAELGENHDRTLERIDRLEQYFARNLTVLYASLNSFLDEHKIEAAQPAIVSAPESSNNDAPPAAANPAAALQKNLLGDLAAAPAQGTGGAAANLLSQAMFDRLLARLDELEKSGRLSSASTNAPLPGSPSLETLIPGLFAEKPAVEASPAPRSLNSTELGIPSGAPEAATIDALALIFEAIFESPTLPDTVKSALSSLQIPTLKAAMLDPSFFTAETHPARLLLDHMARATLGLPREVAAGHPLCTRLREIAAQVRSEFATDPQVFERQLGELNSLIADRDAAIARAAMDYLPLLHQVDRRSKIEAVCRQVVEKYCAPGIPSSIASFLRQHWQQVLLTVALESGEHSQAWQEHIEVIDKLLWSIEPKTDLEERSRLAKTLPAMLQRLNTGMGRIGMSEEARSAFLDACFALQTAALRGTPTVTSVPTSQTASEPVVATPPLALEIESGELLLKMLDPATSQTAQGWLTRPQTTKVGDWLWFNLEQGSRLCGRLCHVSSDSGRSLLLNPDWGFAVALHPGVLDQQLRDGSARICTADSLFNTAAEEALQRTVPL